MDMKCLFINKHNYNCEVFREFWSVTNQIVRFWVHLNSAVISFFSWLLFYNFQGFINSFNSNNVNMCSSSEDTLRHFIVSRKQCFSGRRLLYFDQFTDFKLFFGLQMTSFILKIVCRNYHYKICLCFRFCHKNGKTRKLFQCNWFIISWKIYKILSF